MLQDQIIAIQEQEDGVLIEIALLEEELKKTKSKLAIIKRAKQSLEKLEEQLNGQVDISE